VLRNGGHLLIADFAPHALEFLRDDYHHRRLGFSDREIHSWLDAAGLKSVTGETIVPRAVGGDKLIVKIWLAAKPANAKSASEAA
ncbi:MAG: ArsR family transcriptional regulator, partial [Alphaproteobacteria bacterium]|nr:ArsR family transcriptional regulator [Alphaproteobacteria bacterium]MBV9904013.1 ArsR family transcriptional regulator [Alphaproteobacteria bacterium]